MTGLSCDDDWTMDPQFSTGMSNLTDAEGDTETQTETETGQMNGFKRNIQQQLIQTTTGATNQNLTIESVRTFKTKVPAPRETTHLLIKFNKSYWAKSFFNHGFSLIDQYGHPIFYSADNPPDPEPTSDTPRTIYKTQQQQNEDTAEPKNNTITKYQDSTAAITKMEEQIKMLTSQVENLTKQQNHKRSIPQELAERKIKYVKEKKVQDHNKMVLKRLDDIMKRSEPIAKAELDEIWNSLVVMTRASSRSTLKLNFLSINCHKSGSITETLFFFNYHIIATQETGPDNFKVITHPNYVPFYFRKKH
ncbi:unnamed protein product [Ambrosiozyma monospora]|uniref:Unnamed protein product n=1 Tax=Ambrosiozyma monospora TaxID=43982 RepID=A0A9W6YWX5_AMBMO|nr:unnamed protein product [Ambrosiozyma monospora]